MDTPLFTSLNDAQKEAVFTIDQPMLIIAGAGTGKTRVITSRILYLLLEKKVPAHQILALTFTEKAANEMLERLDKTMPLSYEEVTIKTFHGFCDQILRERGMDIGIDPGYELLSSAQQWIFLKKNIFSFDLDYYRPLNNPSKFFFALLNHFSRLKDEDISPENYSVYAQNFPQQFTLPLTTADQEQATKLLEVAQAYKHYQSLMLKNNFLDFGDLQYYALRLFEKRASVLEEYRKRYRYILVDEFQDTNFAQQKLVTLLAQQHRNLTVVGDDDQAIYKWRGASLTNILSFKKNFPEALKVVLSENYRSSQDILDASHSVIQNNNPYRLESQEHINKKLLSPRGYETPVSIRHFSSYHDEGKNIAETITSYVKQKKARYGDFALLTRTNSQSNTFIQIFKDYGIPFTTRDTQGLLHYEEIKDLIALVRFIAQPHDDVAFFRLMSLPIFSIPMSDILDIVKRAKEHNFEPLFYYLRIMVRDESPKQMLPGFDVEKNLFVDIYKLFNSLLDFSRNHSINRVLGEFLKVSGYYNDLTHKENAENTEKIQHIGQFLEVAQDFQNETEAENFHAFLEYLKLMDEAQGFLGASVNVSETDAVTVLTVHSSKGLEFPYVFIPSLVAQRFPTINRSDPLPIPEALVAEELPSGDMHLQEERRLFYVACTRAARQLFLSYSDFYEGNKKWKKSLFIDEIQESSHAVFEELGTTEEDIDKKKDTFSPPPETGPLSYVPPHSLHQMSYSKIDTFETCPLKYKFRYVFGLATPSSHQASFGSSLHNTLNLFHQHLKKGGTASLDVLRDIFEKSWIMSGYESRAHEQKRKKQGWETMERFFLNEEKKGFSVPAFLEKAFRLKIGDFIVNGRIDRIDKLDDGTYEVIDYKTGTYKKGENLEKDLQLSLYALACQEVFHLKVSKLSLFFLEDAMKTSTTRSFEKLQSTKQEFLDLAGKIKHSDFQPTPGFWCGFCDFRLLCAAAQT